MHTHTYTLNSVTAHGPGPLHSTTEEMGARDFTGMTSHRDVISFLRTYLKRNVQKSQCSVNLGTRGTNSPLTAILLMEICPAPVVCTWGPGRAAEHSAHRLTGY